VNPIFDPCRFNHSPRGLYLHIPFCKSKCPYCDFYSRPGRESEIPAFVEALLKEIKLYGGRIDKIQPLATIFFGGGTPSLLTGTQLEKILAAIGDQFSISPNAEISLEANPGEINREKLKSYHELGINRLSLGCQSFNDEQLKFLQRIHTAETALKSYAAARSAGFGNINIDLIFNIPGQTEDDWENDLLKAVELAPDHISAYSLTLESGTPLFKRVRTGQVCMPGEAADAKLFTMTREVLRRAGYEAYEVSNFAKAGYQCRHNLAYWQFKPYLGLGPSAHSYSGASRWWNHASLTTYLAEIKEQHFPVAGAEQLTARDMFNEQILNGLRLNAGLSVTTLQKHYPGDFSNWMRAKLAHWPGLQLIGDNLKIKGEAVLLTDEISADLFLN